MTKFRALLQRITALFHRDHRDADLAAELESHLQFHIEDNLRAGMSAEEARRQALLKLGGIDQTRNPSAPAVVSPGSIPFFKTLASHSG